MDVIGSDVRLVIYRIINYLAVAPLKISLLTILDKRHY